MTRRCTSHTSAMILSALVLLVGAGCEPEAQPDGPAEKPTAKMPSDPIPVANPSPAPTTPDASLNALAEQCKEFFSSASIQELIGVIEIFDRDPFESMDDAVVHCPLGREGAACRECATAIVEHVHGPKSTWQPPDNDDAELDDAAASPASDEKKRKLARVGTRFRAARPQAAAADMTPSQKEELQDLMALGYLGGYSEAPESQDVTLHDAQSAFNGLNLYCSGHAPEAVAMDMAGSVLHRWRLTIENVWPDAYRSQRSGFWRRVHWFPNGDILAIFEGIGLIKLDKDSNLLWAYRGACHHEAFVTDDGRIHVLTRRVKLLQKINAKQEVIEDLIAVLSPDGELIEEYSIVECFANSNYASLIQKTRDDIFHTNAIHVFDGSLSGISEHYKKGNVLISVLYMHSIAIIDPVRQRVVWALPGRQHKLFSYQHDPSPLPNGNLLIFANSICGQPALSQIVEFDPFSGRVDWTYGGTRESQFSTRTCGSNARLPNGNTLITESDNGRAFEVTSGGKIVWEFYNPHRAGDKGELIATLFDVVRVSEDFFPWLTTPNEDQ